MDAAPRERYPRRRGVEVFAGYLAEPAAVDGVGKVRAEFFQIEMFGAAPDLLVGGKGDRDPAMFYRIIGEQPLRHRHDLGDAGLVVRPEQRRAVCDDEAFADIIPQYREVGLPHNDIFLFVKDDVAAAIGDDSRPDILAGGGGRDVHVGDKAEDWDVVRDIRGNGGVKIAVLVKADVSEPHLLHLIFKKARHLPDAGRAR
ncbi:hypothetical protein SDC9_134114 [bioreactor metagenome]|uniref:Uncharacterized protein n=1 Tax=bioreactor metagenome TaxID=1076179 RepID=A0A645DCF5_9ZZZZ